ncbi:MAG: hypothetical protein KAR42_12150 [candidate division Zixibacteria bacterium]|nr:hypothetical protein [candidate division Zixibacteria bacterium]
MNSEGIDFKKIAAYLQGKLKANEKKATEKEIAQNPVLKTLIEMSLDWKSELADKNWQQAGKSVHALLSKQLDEIKAAEKNTQWMRGITTFDSKLLPIPEGVRPATVDTRRIKIQLGNSQLDISLYPVSTGSYELIGQLIDWNSVDIHTIVLKGSNQSLSADTNQFQLFQFPRVSAGHYSMKVKLGRKIIAVIDLDL